MSSLRLALKQSLQESGGGTFSSGHGDKRKRKKKKNSSIDNAKKGRRDGEVSSKRKRGRPRKHPIENEDAAFEEQQKSQDRKQRSKIEDEESDFESENEFSYESGEDYDDDDDGIDEDLDDDDESDNGSPYRSRSRDADEEEEGELDEGIHSDEDDPKGGASKSNEPEKPSRPQDKMDADAKGTTMPAVTKDTTMNTVSSERKVPSFESMGAATAEEEEEMMRKKLKLQKLKKKLEKNQSQDSAASKIQSQWKKKKNKESPNSKELNNPSTTNTAEAEDEKKRQNKGDAKPTLPGTEAESSGPVTEEPSSNESQQRQEKVKAVDGIKIEKAESNKDVPSASGSKSSKSSAPAGESGSTKAPGGEEKAPSAKKNGYVPAPTKDVKQWAANMSEKKCRKHIRIGMRVKVRFQIPVKRNGKSITKKKFFGGKVIAISKKCNKIRIKYDDGTSEVTKFPDPDVYVDAVDNGEHEVPADKFIPPPLEEEFEEEILETNDVPPPTANEAKEEGEIPTPKASDAPVAMETEEGEVQEDAKPKAPAAEASEESDIQKNFPKQLADDTTTQPAATTPPKAAINAPTIPPPDLPKAENTEASNDDVQMKPAPSQEEGELSPGITVATEEQTKENKSSAESAPLPSQELLPSNIASEKATSEPIKFSADKPLSKATGSAQNSDGEQGSEKSDAPSKPKKLSIRIPSNSLATLKNLTPKSTASQSPKATALSSYVAPEAEKVNDLEKDVPVAKNDTSTKRKRTPDEETEATEPSTDIEPPAKRRIKVGKDLLDAATLSTQPQTEEVAQEMAVEQKELAPIAEEAISAGENKKKKKRADRAKSPRPKSPVPIPEPDKIKSKTDSNSSEASAAVTPKQQKIGSKGSAFSAKKSAKEDGADASVAELINAPGLIRTGRKAAEEAKEKLSVKQKLKEEKLNQAELSKKKKKRRREMEEEQEEDAEEVDPGELEWVQCDKCKKWRVLPDNVKAASLPDQWYCQMNIYDPKRNNCDAPEQNMKQLLRERKKKARKRQKMLELAELEKSAKKNKQQEDEEVVKTKKKKEKLQAAGSTPRSVSPKPPKSGKSKDVEGKKVLEGGKKAKEDATNQTDSGSDTQKEIKKKGKKGKKEAQDSAENQDADDAKKGGRKRGRPARNQTTTVPTSSSANDVDEDQVEWVQCDKCQKWRKLPPHISADEMPDVWNCTMNNWNPSAASCDVAEDKADAHHQEVGASEWQLRQLHAGKYSYRQLIFGTGARKHNRPMSERSRAAESLFIQPVTSDSETPYPTTQYSKSSAFLPRLTNFDKRHQIEENTIGIFDVLRNSNLWEDLRTMEMKPSKVLSSSTSALNIPGQKFKTYDSLSDEMKHAMQDVVLQTLEFGCLTGDEITGKAQWYPYETSIKGVNGIRGYCNEDIIIHTLLDLVRDGLVEMATVKDPFLPVSQWVPRYRRVGTRRAFEAVDAIKKSRCMKIAKPWKQRPSENTTTTEWVTGQNTN